VSFSHIIHLYFVPWPMINNLTNYDRIMYSTLMCFHLYNFLCYVMNFKLALKQVSMLMILIFLRSTIDVFALLFSYPHLCSSCSDKSSCQCSSIKFDIHIGGCWCLFGLHIVLTWYLFLCSSYLHIISHPPTPSNVWKFLIWTL
jgi:hypothetical protein